MPCNQNYLFLRIPKFKKYGKNTVVARIRIPENAGLVVKPNLVYYSSTPAELQDIEKCLKLYLTLIPHFEIEAFQPSMSPDINLSIDTWGFIL
jgi:hypothetical protein